LLVLPGEKRPTAGGPVQRPIGPALDLEPGVALEDVEGGQDQRFLILLRSVARKDQWSDIVGNRHHLGADHGVRILKRDVPDFLPPEAKPDIGFTPVLAVCQENPAAMECQVEIDPRCWDMVQRDSALEQKEEEVLVQFGETSPQ